MARLLGDVSFFNEVINIGNKRGTTIVCDYCGKEAHKSLQVYNSNNHHFCSFECQQSSGYNENNKTEFRNCEICGSEFETMKNSTQRFCDIVCQGKWQSTVIGDLNPRSKKVHIPCEWCGSDSFIPPYRLKASTYHFCSGECRKAWYSNVYSQSDEWKEESRKRAATLLAIKPVQVNSKPQQIINNILDQLYIRYKNEEPIVYYSIDNYLSDYNLMIEVMGDYWHSNPLKYTPEKINDKQKHIISRDKAKHTYVLNQYNIEILYLWEKDIINNPELCKALINEYINKHGILKNYNSFNYFYKNNKLELNENII